MKYNLSAIMKKAWYIFRKYAVSFGEALHRAWLTAKVAPINASRIEEARQRAGIYEVVKTWSQWRESGFQVAHGSKCLFQVLIAYPSKGDNATYTASFFGESQVEAIA